MQFITSWINHCILNDVKEIGTNIYVAIHESTLVCDVYEFITWFALNKHISLSAAVSDSLNFETEPLTNTLWVTAESVTESSICGDDTVSVKLILSEV